MGQMEPVLTEVAEGVALLAGMRVAVGMVVLPVAVVAVVAVYLVAVQ